MTNDTQHRPRYLDEMIGQCAIKQKASIAIQAALQRGDAMPHCLLTSAGGGLGKTTLAGVLSNELLVPLISTTGQCLATPYDLRNILVRLQPKAVLLVDEFHCIGKYAAEELLIVLEEGVLNVTAGPAGAPVRIEVAPFTLVAATTFPEAISAPLAQRFGLKFRFEFYSDQEVCQIIIGIFQRWNLEIAEDAAFALARRARGVPRIGLRLAERARDVAQAQVMGRITLQIVNIAMKIEGVDDAGLSREERQLLRILADADPRPLSARSLALGLGSSIGTVHDVLEPPLVRLGLLTIGAGGRRLTAKGRNHVDAVGLLPFP
jgi:Holliday junction DNA helicase RuvB